MTGCADWMDEMFIATQNETSQNATTPEMAIQLLKDGNKRFLNDTSIERDYHYQVKATSKGQFPFAVVF